MGQEIQKVTKVSNPSQTSEIGRFQMAKYPEITARISSVDSNAFMIMGTVTRAMKRGGVPKEDIDAYFAEATSGDYDKVIRTSFKYVNCE
jgi:hypothetical protein